MIKMDLENLLSGFVGAVIGAIIAVVSSYMIFRQQQKDAVKKSHSERLKAEVLEPWLRTLSQYSSYDIVKTTLTIHIFYVEHGLQDVNPHLLDDLLKNHIPKLHELKKSMDDIEDEIKKEAEALGVFYKKKFSKFNDLKITSVSQILSFFTNDPKYGHLRLDPHNLSYANEVFAQGDDKQLEHLKSELEHDYNSSIGKEWRTRTRKLEDAISALKDEIEHTLAQERIPGSCNLAST